MAFDYLHLSLAFACFYVAFTHPAQHLAAMGSGVFYLLGIFLAHALFEYPNLDYNRYFITYAVFDAIWAFCLLLCRSYLAGWLMFVFMWIDIAVLRDSDSILYKNYEYIMVIMNILFMFFLVVDERFQLSRVPDVDCSGKM